MSSLEAAPSPEAVPPVAVGRRLPPARILVLALLAGSVAGVASWLAGEALHGRFQPTLRAGSGFPTSEEALGRERAIRSAATWEATLAFGSLGAALGLTLGAAGGLVRRSARAALIGAGLGVALGTVGGAALTRALMPIYYRFYEPDNEDLALAIAIQGGIGAAIGATGGAAFGVGLGGRGRAAHALLGGLLGALAGVLVYEMVGALAFPLDQTTRPISATTGTRLFARLAVALCAAAGATRGAPTVPQRAPTPSSR